MGWDLAVSEDQLASLNIILHFISFSEFSRFGSNRCDYHFHLECQLDWPREIFTKNTSVALFVFQMRQYHHCCNGLHKGSFFWLSCTMMGTQIDLLV